MAIASTDVLFYYSVKTGSAGDSTTGTASGSLGKYVSQTQLATGANGLFDDISGAENAASTVDYRCVFVRNNHATLTASNVAVYLSSEVSGGAGISIAVDTTTASAKGSSSAQADLVTNETTAPTGVGSFSSPTTDVTGLSLGSLAPGQVRAVWVKRTAANTSPLDSDGVTLAAGFDTAA